MASLDDILAGGDVTASAPDNTTQTAPEREAAPQPTEQAAPADDSDAPELDVNGQRMVPKAALDAARGKVKRYTEQVAEFEKRLTESQAQNQQFMRDIMSRIAPQQQPQQPQAPDWFENPEAATRYAVAPELQRFEQQHLYNSKLIANQVWGKETVETAQQAFIQAAERGQVDQRDIERLANSPNRFEAAVEWHKRFEVVSDPQGWQERQRAAIRAEVEAELRGGGAPPNGAARPGNAINPAAMPSNLAGGRNVVSRTNGPAWAGPQPLDSILASRKF